MELTEGNREPVVNLMDLIFDDDWFRQAVAAEEGCDVSAGEHWVKFWIVIGKSSQLQ